MAEPKKKKNPPHHNPKPGKAPKNTNDTDLWKNAEDAWPPDEMRNKGN